MDIIISNTFAALKGALTDAEMEQDFEILNQRSVRAIGGCCGIGPKHIDVLVKEIKSS